MSRSFTRLITTPAAGRMVRDWNRPVVSFLTDFGARDPSAGILHGVILGIAPDALIVDVSHEVAKFQVRDGALLLWSALPYLPIGSHVGVVDPGVGTDRRGVALETARGDFLIGPDNGLLLPGAERLGGIVRAHQLLNPQYRLPVVTSTFHGRDVFAPAAAHLALGVPLEMMGPEMDPRDLEPLDWPMPEIADGELTVEVVYLDTYGNVKLGALGADLESALGMLTGGERLEVAVGGRRGGRDQSTHEVTYQRTFGSVAIGQPLLYEDSYGRLCLAVNQGSAVAELGLHDRDEVHIRIAGRPPVRKAAPEAETTVVPVPIEAAVVGVPAVTGAGATADTHGAEDIGGGWSADPSPEGLPAELPTAAAVLDAADTLDAASEARSTGGGWPAADHGQADGPPTEEIRAAAGILEAADALGGEGLPPDEPESAVLVSQAAPPEEMLEIEAPETRSDAGEAHQDGDEVEHPDLAVAGAEVGASPDSAEEETEISPATAEAPSASGEADALEAAPPPRVEPDPEAEAEAWLAWQLPAEADDVATSDGQGEPDEQRGNPPAR